MTRSGELENDVRRDRSRSPRDHVGFQWREGGDFRRNGSVQGHGDGNQAPSVQFQESRLVFSSF